MSDPEAYQPISCALHDRLEHAATVGRTVRLVHRGPDGTLSETTDRLVDVFADGGAEYVETAGGLLIRLDRLKSMDGTDVGV